MSSCMDFTSSGWGAGGELATPAGGAQKACDVSFPAVLRFCWWGMLACDGMIAAAVLFLAQGFGWPHGAFGPVRAAVQWSRADVRRLVAHPGPGPERRRGTG